MRSRASSINARDDEGAATVRTFNDFFFASMVPDSCTSARRLQPVEQSRDSWMLDGRVLDSGWPRWRQHCLCGVLVLSCSLPALAAADDSLELEFDGDPAAGHLRLTWSGGPDAAQYELQEATRADFADAVVRYRGGHTASVLSGLDNGDFYYRVRVLPDDASLAGAQLPARNAPLAELGESPALATDNEPGWSDSAHFHVQHYSLPFALTLLVCGGLIFAATVFFLTYFSRRVTTDD